MFDGLRRLRNPGQSDSRVRQGRAPRSQKFSDGTQPRVVRALASCSGYNAPEQRTDDTLGNGELGLLPRAAAANRNSEEQAGAK